MTGAAHAAAPASARRRPDALVLVFVVEVLIAWVLAAPWSETLARTVGAHPDGDRVAFWHPGGLLLVDLAERLRGVLSALVAATSIGLAVFALASVFVLGAWTAAIDDPGRPLRAAIARGAEVFWRLLVLGVVSGFAACVVAALLGIIPAWGISVRLADWDPRAALFLISLPLLVSAVFIAAILAAADLARARVVRHDMSLLAALAILRDRRAVWSQLVASAPRWLASIGLLGWGAAISSHSLSVTTIFLSHQAIAFARVALRGSVLARALRLAGARAAASGIE
ncbi:MAG: hypothetical protein HYV09_20320 [Deltaproteobacteria bacterium]|nr:hypothetical protein [Deltaproteobacteria bacterium]